MQKLLVLFCCLLNATIVVILLGFYDASYFWMMNLRLAKYLVAITIWIYDRRIEQERGQKKKKNGTVIKVSLFDDGCLWTGSFWMDIDMSTGKNTNANTNMNMNTNTKKNESEHGHTWRCAEERICNSMKMFERIEILHQLPLNEKKNTKFIGVKVHTKTSSWCFGITKSRWSVLKT